MGIKYSEAENKFLREHIHECYTLYDLLDMFNAEFPNHQLKTSAMQKHLTALGLRKGTHNIRKEKVKSKNPIETVIKGSGGIGHGARVKTENGYVAAGRYFKEKYFGDKDGKLVHLNGDNADFSRENVVLVSRYIFSSLQWRGWIFKDPELTKTAILTAELLSFFPDLTHNENQYYRLRSTE